ncbi:MAG: OB-fold domain-containing protein [Phascolarctobacterium faecium]
MNIVCWKLTAVLATGSLCLRLIWGQLAVGMEARVHTYMAVREDAILLFGFLNQEYYNLFLLLLGVMVLVLRLH